MNPGADTDRVRYDVKGICRKNERLKGGKSEPVAESWRGIGALAGQEGSVFSRGDKEAE